MHALIEKGAEVNKGDMHGSTPLHTAAYKGHENVVKALIEKNGTKIISSSFKNIEVDELRNLSDSIRSKEQNSVILFGSDNNGKPLLLFAATKPAVDNGIDCGKIIKDSARIIGGGGGGRKDMAQAGGKSSNHLDNAIKEAVSIAKNMIS